METAKEIAARPHPSSVSSGLMSTVGAARTPADTSSAKNTTATTIHP
jgi:hypothetical protein